MSSSSSNASARRRRASNVPTNTIKLKQQNAQNVRISNNSQNVNIMNKNGLNMDGLPSDERGQPMHPINILKNMNERLTMVESNRSSNSNNNNDNEIAKMRQVIQTELTNIKQMNEKYSNEYKELKSSVELMQEKFEEIKELCSKIQTFSMETNVSFLLFKNQYDKEKSEEKPNFMNILQQFGNSGMSNFVDEDNEILEVGEDGEDGEDEDEDEDEENDNIIELDMNDSNIVLNNIEEIGVNSLKKITIVQDDEEEETEELENEEVENEEVEDEDVENEEVENEEKQ